MLVLGPVGPALHFFKFPPKLKYGCQSCKSGRLKTMSLGSYAELFKYNSSQSYILHTIPNVM
jgi:hypothetical protein